jgi:hypothetical protein
MQKQLSPNIDAFSKCSEVHDTAISNADSIHSEHRLLLKRELGRMVLFLTDQPTLLPPNLQVSVALPLQTVMIAPKMQRSLFLQDNATRITYLFLPCICLNRTSLALNRLATLSTYQTVFVKEIISLHVITAKYSERCSERFQLV